MPDMYWEEMISQADGRQLPQFSVIVRGYQITFRAKVSYNEDGMPRYGLFASCSSLKAVNTEDDELNFKASCKTGPSSFHRDVWIVYIQDLTHAA